MTEPIDVYDPAQFRREYIETDTDLLRIAEELAGADAVGVDLEMAQRILRKPGGIQEWQHVLGLLQIASDTLSVVIDPLRVSSLQPLAPLMAGPARKVFLGGGQDVALLEREALPVRTIVDVGEAAYALFGRREDGMAALSRRIFGISLDKTVRRTDWLVRPLNRMLINYAFQDAELTLLIYRWFQAHHPVLLEMHERLELEPGLPATTPPWLQETAVRTATNPAEILAEHGLDPAHDAERVGADVVAAIRSMRNAPRRINRLIRVASELGISQVLPDIIPFADSQSSLLRAGAARALGRLGTRDEVGPILERLAQDPLEDVRKAAEAGLRDLKRPKTAPAPKDEEEPAPTLNQETVEQLQELLRRLQPGEDSLT
jgi:hypothetical protein